MSTVRPHARTELELPLAAARSGCPRARAQLYERFAATVHGIVLCRLGPADADDATQEVFVNAFRALDQVRDAAALPGWIAALARNLAVDWLRRRRRAARVPLPELGREDRRDSELAERVFALIAGLPEAYREPLTLRLVEGLTGPEIAARVGMTPGSVRVNLCRGLAMLRPLLEREGWP